MADGGRQVSLVKREVTGKPEKEARIIHVVLI